MYQTPGNPYGNTYGAPQRAATKKEFLAFPENQKMKKEINTAAILCYICAGITFLISVILSGNLVALVDILILVGLGIGFQLTLQKIYAILLTVYGGINLVLTIVLTGSVGGWLPLLAAIVALIYIGKLDKAWDAYNAQFGQQPYGYGNYPPPPPPAGM